MDTVKKKKNFRKRFWILLFVDLLLLLLICSSAVGVIWAAQNLASQAEEKDAARVEAMYQEATEVNIPDALRQYTADRLTKQESIPAYSLEQIYSLDLRKPSGVTEADLKLVTSQGLVGLEEAFVHAEEKYGVNCVFLMSIASLESAKGTMMFRPNNMFGYGRSGFSSKAEGIHVVAEGLSTKYLKPGSSLYGGSPTVKGVNKRYAANPQWHAKVGKYMVEYYAVISKRHKEALSRIK